MDIFLGIALYALLSGKIDCKAVEESISVLERPAIAVLPTTFGRDYDCLNRLLSRLSDRDHLLVVYLDNAFCRRHRVCEKAELFSGLSPERLNRKVEREDRHILRGYRLKLQSILRRVKRSERTVLLVALALEDNFSEKAAKKLFHSLQTIEGDFAISRNPVGDGSNIKFTRAYNSVIELHDKDPKFPRKEGVTKIYNYDGQDLQVEEIRRDMANLPDLFAVFIWRKRWQDPGIFPIHKRRFIFDNEDVNFIRRIYGN